MQERTGSERPIYRWAVRAPTQYSRTGAATRSQIFICPRSRVVRTAFANGKSWCPNGISCFSSTATSPFFNARLAEAVDQGHRGSSCRQCYAANHPTHRAVSPARKLINRRYNSPYGYCCQPHFRGSEILQFSNCSTSTIEPREALRMV